MAARVIPKPEFRLAATKSLKIKIFDDDHDDDDIALIYSAPSSSSLGTNAQNAIPVDNYRKRRAPSDGDSDVKVLDFAPPLSSKRKTFTCEICTEKRPTRRSFKIMGCTHVYCSQCIVNYVSSRLENNIVQINCPVMGCAGLLEPYQCRLVLPPEVLDRWGKALCESTILESQKFYCPFKDCSALLVADNGATTTAASPATATEVITQLECPYCWRLFCAQCRVPWHSEISCSEFQKLGKNEREREDIMLMKLAEKNKWMRCSKCNFYVEKTQGCLFMKCRCGHTFCYKCGNSPLINHYCPKCKH